MIQKNKELLLKDFIAEKALNRYPIKIMNNNTNQWDNNYKLRKGYEEGYKQTLGDIYKYLKSVNAIKNTYVEFIDAFINYNRNDISWR